MDKTSLEAEYSMMNATIKKFNLNVRLLRINLESIPYLDRRFYYRFQISHFELHFSLLEPWDSSKYDTIKPIISDIDSKQAIKSKVDLMIWSQFYNKELELYEILYQTDRYKLIGNLLYYIVEEFDDMFQDKYCYFNMYVDPFQKYR